MIQLAGIDASQLTEEFSEVYQFKITLRHIRPAIYRIIQVPENYSFWELHVAIQDAMGWKDCHLHEFKIKDLRKKEIVKIGIPDPDGFGSPVMEGWEINITEYFTSKNKKAAYDYDFGDNWDHKVKLEKMLPKEEGVDYPRCIEGKRACPPEDCGGVWGYRGLVKIFKKGSAEERAELLGDFDPDRFEPGDVVFSDLEPRFEKFMEAYENGLM